MNKTDAIDSASYTSSSQKSTLKQITLDLTSDEAQNLKNYCEQTGKEVTNVIEELIQKLPVV
ncbi:CopG family transcriptional regulator [Nostoc parmelioides]|uniref:CopG family transcriptional regulator n=1 Tax=Nostoc parmelioides FACHB-3921 TaxID=2692909 RepID=A0ABR8BL51_9NOSO|nr:CopG family transcriptional regulator [Nostoc parmelioides]MBD2254294.1 CopG family transcriptional regulator [Nostoc parmelioides FACHB-3921]